MWLGMDVYYMALSVEHLAVLYIMACNVGMGVES
jgi:hypothetical protein